MFYIIYIAVLSSEIWLQQISLLWGREPDSNRRPSGNEPDKLPSALSRYIKRRIQGVKLLKKLSLKQFFRKISKWKGRSPVCKIKNWRRNSFHMNKKKQFNKQNACWQPMQESNLRCESQSLVSYRLTNGLYKRRCRLLYSDRRRHGGNFM